MKLREIRTDAKDREAIEWMRAHSDYATSPSSGRISSNKWINVDGNVVTVDGNIDLHKNASEPPIDKLPVQFGFVNGYFSARKLRLSDLHGLPRRTASSLNIGENPFSDLTRITKDIGLNLLIDNTRLTSLHDIHKHVTHIANKIYLSTSVIKSHILGLMLIPRLQLLENENGDRPWKKNRYEGPFIIVDKFLERKNGVVNKKLMYECQAELIDAGYEEFAKL